MAVNLLLLQMMLVMLLFIKVASASAQNSNRSVALPGCQERCGSLVVPYPFGIGENCSAHWSVEMTCNNSFNSPKAFLRDAGRNNLEVLNISLEAATIRVNHPIYTDCTNPSDVPLIQLYGPFTYSDTENRFTAMGCDNYAKIITTFWSIWYGGLGHRKPITRNPHRTYSPPYHPPGRINLVDGGCVSICIEEIEKDNSCFGVFCCQTRFRPSLNIIQPYINNTSSDLTDAGCSSDGPRYAFIVEQKWFEKLKDIHSVKTMEKVPAVLNWNGIGNCHGTNESIDIQLVCGNNTLCTNQSSCSCKKGYQGNPYLPEGCQDIDECERDNRCQQICTNTLGSYNCSCKDGWLLVGNFKCVPIEVIHNVKKEVKKVAIIVITATCAGLGVLLATTWWLFKVMRQRKTRKQEEKFFKRNGGLLLRQQVSSNEGNVETTRLFTSKELEKATDRYNADRIVGQGGQGTVYKGMLTDGRIVAVKKSKIEDESKLDHFINEVVILSQINHRNIVKLHGCCLQTEIPLLIYEFIPNGTLMQYIHEDNECFPLTWDVRVRVATEIAGALYYLHSGASIPIYHRDIKSTNILLDDKYRAKVADFGTSRSFSIDQTHLTTRVQGTFGYLDPEYFQSSQFTDKSDVYSFGVVLVELLTGQKPILAARLDDEARGLATLFLLAMEENRLLDIIDSRIINEGRKEEMIAFANIAYRCLNLNGRRRPAMKQVVAELESIRNTHGSPTAQQNYEVVEYGKLELNAPWESDFTSTSMSSTVYHSFNVDIEPLMTN